MHKPSPHSCAVHQMFGATTPVLATKICKADRVEVINGKEKLSPAFKIPVCKDCASAVERADGDMLYLLFKTSYLAQQHSPDRIEAILNATFDALNDNQ